MVGNTIKKYIKNITIGEINFPNNSPNFIQIFLSGLNKLEFNNPKIKKIKDIGIRYKKNLFFLHSKNKNLKLKKK